MSGFLGSPHQRNHQCHTHPHERHLLSLLLGSRAKHISDRSPISHFCSLWGSAAFPHSLELVRGQEFQLLIFFFFYQQWYCLRLKPGVAMIKSPSICTTSTRELFAHISSEFVTFLSVTRSSVQNKQTPALSLCLILASPAKASSTFIFQAPVAFWAISQQSRKMHFPHSISGITSSHHFKNRKGVFLTHFSLMQERVLQNFTS